jgi:hypothetical protein
VRSSNGIFLGYDSHSRAFRVLNLDTNLVMETCDVTFDDTQPCSSSVFECAGDDEVGKTLRMRRMVRERIKVMMVKLQPRLYPLLPLR